MKKISLRQISLLEQLLFFLFFVMSVNTFAELEVVDGPIKTEKVMTTQLCNEAGTICTNVSGGVVTNEVDPTVSAAAKSIAQSNITNWNEAYSQRGSVIAGNYLTWTGSKLNVTDSWYNSVAEIPTAAPVNGDTTHLSTSDQIYDFVQGYPAASITTTNITKWDTAYAQRGEVLAGNYLTWTGSKLNVTTTVPPADGETTKLSNADQIYDFVTARMGGGSGTTNYLPKFTSSTAIGDSIVSQSGGDVVVVGSDTIWSSKLNIKGDGHPGLIIEDTDGSTSRPTIAFKGNDLNVFQGDDQSNEFFDFYSDFQPDGIRDYDAIISIHGNTPAGVADWGRSLSLSHDGTDGRIGTDVGNITITPGAGTLEVSGNAVIAQNLYVSQANQGYVYGGGGQDIGWNQGIGPTRWIADSPSSGNFRFGNGRFMCPAGKYVCGVNNIHNDCDGNTGTCFVVIPICCN